MGDPKKPLPLLFVLVVKSTGVRVFLARLSTTLPQIESIPQPVRRRRRVTNANPPRATSAKELGSGTTAKETLSTGVLADNSELLKVYPAAVVRPLNAERSAKLNVTGRFSFSR